MTFILPSFGASAIAAVPGGFSNAYSVDLDGSVDYVDTNSTFQSTYQSSHTISLWFKLDTTSGLQSLFGAWSGPTSQNAIYFDGSGNIIHRYRVASSPKSTLSASFTPDTNWHHYAVTLTQNGSNLDVKAYLDGVYKSTISNAITMSGFSQSLNSYIGLRNGSTGYLDGKMDEVAIIGSALSDGGVSTGQPAQGNIATLYNGGLPTDISSLNPVGWWRMGDNDGGTGTTITDQGSGSNDGTLKNGPTFSSDAAFRNTYSVDFDGSDDYLDCGSIVSSFSALSVSAWVNADSYGSFNVVASQYTSGSGGSFFLETVGSDMWFAVSTGSGYTGLAKYTAGLSTGSWYHVCGVWDGSSTKVYINGVIGSETGSYSGSLGGSAISFRVGTMLGGYWNGKIDEVGLFNTALSASDVTAIYSGLPNDISSLNPVSWWRMGDNNGGTGTTITDQGSGSNDGTLTNGPTFSTDVPT